MYDDKWLENAIKIGENETQDFKQTITSSEKIAKTIVAFSNNKGGKILIGVKDNGVISGTSITEDGYMIEAAVEKYTRNVLPLKPHVISFRKKKVLVIEVEKNREAVALAFHSEKQKWLAYTRFKDQTVSVGYLGFLFFIEKAKPNPLATFGDNERKVVSYLEKFNETKHSLNELKKNLQLNRKEAISSLLNLLVLEVVKTNYETDEERFELV